MWCDQRSRKQFSAAKLTQKQIEMQAATSLKSMYKKTLVFKSNFNFLNSRFSILHSSPPRPPPALALCCHFSPPRQPTPTLMIACRLYSTFKYSTTSSTVPKTEWTAETTLSPSTTTPSITTASTTSTPSKQQELQEPSKPIVGYWYLFCGSLVFGIVILGGVTRLTESGLSIVEWNLIKGMKPPSSPQEWHQEFEKYKLFPEYKLLNHSITLDEFKRIFYMEWAHRMWGRAIGLCFILPGLYFASKGFMTRAIQSRSLIVATMIGVQGVFGWYMVKSGLDDEIVQKNQVPRVNHFWLSTHLGSAFLIYATMLFTSLEILKQNRIFKAASEKVYNYCYTFNFIHRLHLIQLLYSYQNTFFSKDFPWVCWA